MTKRGDVIPELRRRCSYHKTVQWQQSRSGYLKTRFIDSKIAGGAAAEPLRLLSQDRMKLRKIQRCFLEVSVSAKSLRSAPLSSPPSSHYIVLSVYEPCYYCNSNYQLNARNDRSALISSADGKINVRPSVCLDSCIFRGNNALLSLAKTLEFILTNEISGAT